MNAVAFDCDGVLVDSETLAWGVWDRLLEPFDLRVTEADVAACTGTTERDTHAYFARRVPLAPFDEWLPAYDAALDRIYRERLEAFPDAAAAVAHLAAEGVALAVVSNSPRNRLDAALEVTGLARYFTVSVSADDVARPKPDPDPYLHAARLLGVDPSSVVAVEDSPTGAASAAAAGMRVVTVDRGGGHVGPLATVTEVDAGLILTWLGR
jgi:HAD superfamily hydrolase (TIGR01509 family)